MLRGSRERPRPRGGWSEIGTLEGPDRHESRRARPLSLDSVGRLGTIAALGVMVNGKSRMMGSHGPVAEPGHVKWEMLDKED
jgi:hypothetical protein